MEVVTCVKLDADEFDELVNTHLGLNDYELVAAAEASNYSSIEIHSVDEIDEDDQARLDFIKENKREPRNYDEKGYSSSNSYCVYAWELQRLGIIPNFDMVIDVSW